MVVLSNFDGGLSTRVDPTLIQLNSAQVFINVDPNSVVLKSAKNYRCISARAASVPRLA